MSDFQRGYEMERGAAAYRRERSAIGCAIFAVFAAVILIVVACGGLLVLSMFS